MYTIYPLFSTPIYYSKIDSLATKHVDYITKSKFRRNANNDSNISLDVYVLNSPKLKDLKAQITTHINTYLYDTLKVKRNIKFKFLNSWIMQHGHKDFGPPHAHVNSLFSGIVYIKTSKNCGNVRFNYHLNDLFSQTVSLDYDEYNLYNSSTWYFEPLDGLILLFPSYAAHEIAPNLSNELRYCVAFNIFIEGDLGDIGQINNLSLK
jgi:uncharacterized protein (TIGR02466 family)